MDKYEELNTLKEEFKNMCEIHEELVKNMDNAIQNILDKFIASTNVSDVTASKCGWSNGRWEFRCVRNNETLWDIDFEAEDRWHRDNSHPVSVNIGTSGSFGVEPDKYAQKDKYIFMGKLCENLATIENEIMSLDWKTFYDSDSEVSKLRWKIDSIENDIKNLLYLRDKELMLKKIMVGLVIDTTPNKELPDEKHWNYRTILRNKNSKINWMTKKNITFEGDYKRIKIDEVVDNLVRGSWKIVA